MLYLSKKTASPTQEERGTLRWKLKAQSKGDQSRHGQPVVLVVFVLHRGFASRTTVATWTCAKTAFGVGLDRRVVGGINLLKVIIHLQDRLCVL